MAKSKDKGEAPANEPGALPADGAERTVDMEASETVAQAHALGVVDGGPLPPIGDEKELPTDHELAKSERAAREAALSCPDCTVARPCSLAHFQRVVPDASQTEYDGLFGGNAPTKKARAGHRWCKVAKTDVHASDGKTYGEHTVAEFCEADIAEMPEYLLPV